MYLNRPETKYGTVLDKWYTRILQCFALTVRTWRGITTWQKTTANTDTIVAKCSKVVFKNLTITMSFFHLFSPPFFNLIYQLFNLINGFPAQLDLKKHSLNSTRKSKIMFFLYEFHRKTRVASWNTKQEEISRRIVGTSLTKFNACPWHLKLQCPPWHFGLIPCQLTREYIHEEEIYLCIFNMYVKTPDTCLNTVSREGKTVCYRTDVHLWNKHTHI